MAFVNITREDFEAFVKPLGFQPVNLDGTHELVYGKRLDCNGTPITLRIYSGIEAKTGQSRSVGSDAIRVCMVGRNSDGTIFGICKDRRVNRVDGWVRNLSTRLASISCNDVQACNKCGAPMAWSEKKKRHYCSEICWTK